MKTLMNKKIQMLSVGIKGACVLLVAGGFLLFSCGSGIPEIKIPEWNYEEGGDKGDPAENPDAYAEDAAVIQEADWTTETIADGLVWKSCLFQKLYQGAQAVNILEVDASKCKFGIAAKDDGKTLRTTSYLAEQAGALAAVNGSFFSMNDGGSICYYRIGGETKATTADSEFQLRVNGALHIADDGTLSIMEWDRYKEQQYTGTEGTVLSSGPLVMMEGEYYSLDACEGWVVDDLYPQTAVCTTADGKVRLITVDGRNPGSATGMTKYEFAHLAMTLGAVNSITLDGGGSTTMWIKDKGVVNYPCDNEKFDHEGERNVANAVYVTPK